MLLEGNPFRQDEEVEQGEDRNRTKRKETAGRQQLQNQQLNGRQPRCQSIMTVGKPVLVTRAATSHLQFVCFFRLALCPILVFLTSKEDWSCRSTEVLPDTVHVLPHTVDHDDPTYVDVCVCVHMCICTLYVHNASYCCILYV